MKQARVGIIMGSKSDLPVMAEAGLVLDELEIEYELSIVSAHRTPERMYDYAKTARGRGLRVIIAGAGGAAHLPGHGGRAHHIACGGSAYQSSNSIDGWDSVLSILQMPAGVPVATVALDGARNAGLLAAQIIGTHDERVAQLLSQYKEALQRKVEQMVSEVEEMRKIDNLILNQDFLGG
ncbi:MAG: 5-(carboxyamino)imidazole ribonucleotide mutase [Cytophagales bacterium]|nr:5-(carboxyamino)imidazole ribonucleotide mutase [Cytophagales bacterium]